jgi:hypothetical protein
MTFGYLRHVVFMAVTLVLQEPQFSYGAVLEVVT